MYWNLSIGERKIHRKVYFRIFEISKRTTLLYKLFVACLYPPLTAPSFFICFAVTSRHVTSRHVNTQRSSIRNYFINFIHSLISPFCSELKCTRSDGLVVSTGCKLKEGMYRCGCPIPNGVCVQKEYCTCNQGYQAILNMDGSLESCAAILKVAKSEGKK